jgi:hypothetical protein
MSSRIRERRTDLSRQINGAKWLQLTELNATRRRRHLNLLRAQCDALQQIIDESALVEDEMRPGWAAGSELALGVTRLEHSLKRALARDEQRRASRDNVCREGARPERSPSG